MAGNSFLNRKFSNDRFARRSYLIIGANAIMLIAYLVCANSRFANITSALRFIDFTVFQTDEILKGRRLWTFFTYPFVTTNLLSLLFHSIFLYFFGIRYEMEIGSKEFLFLYFSSSFFSALLMFALSLFTGMNFIALGPAASVFALIFVFSVLHRYEWVLLFFVLPVRLPLVVLILLAIDTLYLYLGIGNVSEILLNFFGFFYALLYVRFRLRISPTQFFTNLF